MVESQLSFHFDPFVGTIYDVPEDYLSSGFSSHVSHFDVMGQVTLDSLIIPKTFVGYKYFPGVTMRTRFGIVFLSHLEIKKEGCFEFYLESDDGSKLWINDSIIIDNDYPHQMFAKRDTLFMKPGQFPVKVWYYNAFESQFGLILRARPLPDNVYCDKLNHSNQLRKVDLDEKVILFDFNSFIITPKGMETLDNVCATLDKLAFNSIRIIGYTDQIGNTEYNQELSLKRAESISDYLKSKIHKSGINFTPEGRGSSALISSSTDEKGRKLNRRVEIFIE